jgi:hypothetical protein
MLSVIMLSVVMLKVVVSFAAPHSWDRLLPLHKTGKLVTGKESGCFSGAPETKKKSFERLPLRVSKLFLVSNDCLYFYRVMFRGSDNFRMPIE